MNRNHSEHRAHVAVMQKPGDGRAVFIVGRYGLI